MRKRYLSTGPGSFLMRGFALVALLLWCVPPGLGVARR
jgi:hypothetical protein